MQTTRADFLIFAPSSFSKVTYKLKDTRTDSFFYFILFSSSSLFSFSLFFLSFLFFFVYFSFSLLFFFFLFFSFFFACWVNQAPWLFLLCFAILIVFLSIILFFISYSYSLMTQRLRVRTLFSIAEFFAGFLDKQF